MKFQGIVLGGGKSSRFGKDKALTLIEGIPMIQRAVNLLTELRLDPCVITNASRNYSFLEFRIEQDLISDRGPMGGLYTACCLFEHSSLVVLTCDMPALTSIAVKHLIECHQEKNRATIYVRNQTSRQPFPGIYEASLRGLIGKLIGGKPLSLQELFKVIPETQDLEFPFDDLALSNINDGKDLNFFLRGYRTPNLFDPTVKLD